MESQLIIIIITKLLYPRTESMDISEAPSTGVGQTHSPGTIQRSSKTIR